MGLRNRAYIFLPEETGRIYFVVYYRAYIFMDSRSETTEWIAGECARAGLTTTTTVPEAEVGSATAPGLPREEPGPREQEPQPQPQAVSPTMDIYHECAAEGCDTLVCNGGERQHMQSPYCSDAC